MFSVKLASRWRKEKIAIDKFWLKFKKIIQITGFLLHQTCDCVTASCFNIVGCWAPTCVLQGRFWSRSSSCWCFVGCHWHTWRWPLVSTLAGDQSEQLENCAHFSKVWDLFCDVLKCFAVDTFCSYIYIPWSTTCTYFPSPSLTAVVMILIVIYMETCIVNDSSIFTQITSQLVSQFLKWPATHKPLLCNPVLLVNIVTGCNSISHGMV